MSALKLTKIGERRLEKLCAFLEVMPRKEFDFSKVRYTNNCGTVGCAIGWTPSVFPKLVKPCSHGNGVRLLATAQEDFAAVAEALFGLPFWTADRLFCPTKQSRVHDSLQDLPKNASPKQVARMLRKFIRLAKAGEIEAE